MSYHTSLIHKMKIMFLAMMMILPVQRRWELILGPGLCSTIAVVLQYHHGTALGFFRMWSGGGLRRRRHGLLLLLRHGGHGAASRFPGFRFSTFGATHVGEQHGRDCQFRQRVGDARGERGLPHFDERLLACDWFRDHWLVGHPRGEPPRSQQHQRADTLVHDRER